MTTREYLLTSNDTALAGYLRNTRAQLRAQDKGLRRLSRRVQRQADYIHDLEAHVGQLQSALAELEAILDTAMDPNINVNDIFVRISGEDRA